MKIKNLNKEVKHKTSIGGQALIEGLLMRGPKDIAVAIRKPDGEIDLKTYGLDTLGMKYKLFRLPFIRGVVGLVESMKIGIAEMLYSSEFIEEDLEDEKEGFIRRHFSKERADSIEMTLTLLTSLALAILLFMLIPNILTSLLKKIVENPILLNLIEGLIRLLVFGIYLFSISRMDEVGSVFDRMWEYHGAEHKTIHCYESGDELTVENVRKHTILHPRCGTRFLFMVMIVSIFVLSFFGWPSPGKRLLIRLIMLPVIAGISYEINRLIGKSSSRLAFILSYPGLMIQKYAT